MTDTTTAPTGGVPGSPFVSLANAVGGALGTALQYAAVPRWARTQVASQSYPIGYAPTYDPSKGPPPVSGAFGMRSPNDPWLRSGDVIGSGGAFRNPDGMFGNGVPSWLIVGGIAAAAIAVVALVK